MDSLDQAQAAEQSDRDNAIRAELARIAAAMPPTATAESLCADCDGPIGAARVAALDGHVETCVECAGRREHVSRGYRRD